MHAKQAFQSKINHDVTQFQLFEERFTLNKFDACKQLYTRKLSQSHTREHLNIIFIYQYSNKFFFTSHATKPGERLLATFVIFVNVLRDAGIGKVPKSVTY